MTRVVLLLLIFIQLVEIRAQYPSFNDNVIERVKDNNMERILMRVLMENAFRIPPQPAKRTCRIEATGECRSEEAADIADKFHFLKSPDSPGRKRSLFS